MKPDGDGPFPAVVLLHYCGGQRHSEWGGFLSGIGYVVMFVDTNASRGLANCGLKNSEDEQLGEEQAADAWGALEFLATLPYVDADRAAVMGFSQGAATIIKFMVRTGRRKLLIGEGGREFRAAIPLYYSCLGLANVTNRRQLAVPVLLINGEKEAITPECKKQVGNPIFGFHLMPGAYHAFDEPVSNGRLDAFGTYMEYSPRATNAARVLVVDFLTTQLAARPPAYWLVGIWKLDSRPGAPVRTLNVVSVDSDGSAQGAWGGQPASQDFSAHKLTVTGDTVTIDSKNGAHAELTRIGDRLKGEITSPPDNKVVSFEMTRVPNVPPGGPGSGPNRAARPPAGRAQ